jgi:hypothetical protein
MMIDKEDGRAIKSERVQLRIDRPTPIVEDVNDTTALTSETKPAQPVGDTGSVPPSSSSDAATSEVTRPSEARMQVADYVSSVHEPVADEKPVKESPTEILNLRAELERAESELSNITSDLDTVLLNLKNTVHVKRIMYEHLKKQLRETRQEWSDAYEEYVKTNQRKKAELDKRNMEIDDLRQRITEIDASDSD